MVTMQIQNLSVGELQEMVQALLKESLKPVFNLIETQQSTRDATLSENMTPKEVAELLRVSTVTVWQWTKDGKLTAYRLSNRKYYKRKEVEKVLLNAKIKQY
jgi:excisionase family DNA binding protein